ncbi:MAG: serine hydrolase [Bacteroidales bacterium]|nr:serine hydrolase [Bacteroidales bacterium]
MTSRIIPALLCIMLAVSCSHRTGLKHSSPESQGMDSRTLELIDSAVNDAISQKIIPGAVVSVVRNGRVVYLQPFGNKSLVPEVEPMTPETMFDLASVSKCVGTTLSFMQLVEQGKVRLSDPVSRYIPDFKPWVDPVTGEEDEITIQDLLTHSSGLDAYIGVPSYLKEFGENTPELLMKYIATRVKRNFKPGTDVIYSCLNFITLQNILQNVTGERLCDYAQKNVFDVLELEHTCYFPLYGRPQSNKNAAELAALCAPTEVQEDGLPLVAAVHDPIARQINAGNSGNAGVFSNAEDLSVIAAAILRGGAIGKKKILGKETVRLMMSIPKDNDPRVARALGWDTYDMYPGTSGDIFEREHTVGHTGYTGTSMVLDPVSNTAVIILAHRVHPADVGSVARLRAVVANIVAASIIE